MRGFGNSTGIRLCSQRPPWRSEAGAERHGGRWPQSDTALEHDEFPDALSKTAHRRLEMKNAGFVRPWLHNEKF